MEKLRFVNKKYFALLLSQQVKALIRNNIIWWKEVSHTVVSSKQKKQQNELQYWKEGTATINECQNLTRKWLLFVTKNGAQSLKKCLNGHHQQ